MNADFHASRDQVAELVRYFSDNRVPFRSPTYNEAQARRDLINPLLVALGWDVHNTRRVAPGEQEVTVEESFKDKGHRRSPDYVFRVGIKPKLFAEAKKPGVPLKTDVAPAYQIRSYAWNANLPISFLTDFEELSVYDCRLRPVPVDQPNVGRVKYFGFEEYLDRWLDIWSLFSREAVWSGALDQFAQEVKAKRGTSEVDTEFLKEIEKWRLTLARNIALRNPRLGISELNDAVQRTIDRVVFLRMAEDRGIEEYEQLWRLAEHGGIYAGLIALSRRADAKYNSGLFDFSSKGDTLTPGLVIDDKVLKPIVAGLYFPQSPYCFNLLPVQILGNVYEQFLGKVIRLTPSHQAKVDEKPEVKKAGGVYYTPAYIVDYIVAQTVGHLIEGKSPEQLKEFRVLDCASGSGSFLLGAYQFLLDYYLQWYKQHDPETHRKSVWKHGDEWRLTVAEKKRILTTHIFGVDIDRQAVEVTKLSLLLKVLEGESDETLGKQLAMFPGRALPNLDTNIKCGNSLIGPDYFVGQLMPDADELRRVNPFDWEREFPEAMNAGGFDAVIGNPPYGAELTECQKLYLQNAFKGQSRSYDTYELFLLKASRVLRGEARLSMIIPASWLTGDKSQDSRRKLVTELNPAVAYALPFDVFKSTYIDTAIVVLTSTPVEHCLIHFFPKKEHLDAVPFGIGKPVSMESIREDPQCRLSIVLSQDSASILRKINSPQVKFGEWFEISRGVQPYSRSKHTEEQIKRRFLHAATQKSKQHLPELQGNELSRYFAEPERSSYLKYGDEIASKRPIRMFQGKRIVLRRLLTRKFRLQASLVTETLITTDNVLNMIPRSTNARVELALGLLNSRLISWVYVNTSMIAQKDDFPQVHISALSAIGLPNFDAARHDKMVSLVEKILELQRRLSTAKTQADRELYQRQIDATDQQIDALVYELYGLTEEEIKVVTSDSREAR